MADKAVLMKTEWTDPVTGAKGYLAIDELIEGICGGGIRMRPGLAVEEIEGLARIMTAKFMAMNIPCGGGKGGIDYDSSKEDSSAVLRRYLLAHRPFLRENWGTSEDLGTREEEIMSILSELEVNTSVHAILERSEPEEKQSLLHNLITGLNMQYDGVVFTDVVTGYGVAVAAREALKKTKIEPAQARAAIQGFGTVGGSSALYISRQGIKIIAVSDADGTIYNEDGLDIPDLLTKRNERGVIDRSALSDACKLEDRDRWMELGAELLVPAAVSEVITAGNVERVNTKLIVEGANMPLTKEAAGILSQQGVKIVPDFIANSGGVGLFGALLFHHLPPEPEKILEYLDRTICDSVNRTFELSREKGLSLYEAANLLVEERRKNILENGAGMVT